MKIHLIVVALVTRTGSSWVIELLISGAVVGCEATDCRLNFTDRNRYVQFSTRMMLNPRNYNW